MQVALVIDRFDPRLGGMEQWTHQFSQRLIRWGHQVHVLARKFSPDVARLGITPHVIAPQSSRLEFGAAVQAHARTLRMDVIHDMGVGWHCDVFQPHGGSRRAANRQNLLITPPWQRPLRATFARYLPRYREFERLVELQYADQPRVFLAISQMVQRDFRELHNLRQDRIRLIYNGVDLQRFSPAHRHAHRERVRRELNVGDNETLLLIVAHNFRLKGVSTAIRSVGALRDAGLPVRLAVAGGSRLNRWRRYADRFGARGAVDFVGSVADPVPYYAAADVYVQPTYYDPCSLVVLEAAASGLPVVTSRFNGAGELFTPGSDGFICQDPGDSTELAALLAPLVDRQTHERMGVAARAMAEQHSLDENCQRIVDVYEQLAGKARRAA